MTENVSKFMSEFDQWNKERQSTAEEIISGLTNGNLNVMTEKQWIIARLLFLLYKEGRNSDTPDAQRTTAWFSEKFYGKGHEVLMLAFARLVKENRETNEKTYQPFWKNGWQK